MNNQANNYSSGSRPLSFQKDESPLIEELSLNEGSSYNNKSHMNEILFILDGSGICECDFFRNFDMKNQYAYFIPIGNKYNIKATERMHILWIRLDIVTDLHGFITLRQLTQGYKQLEPDNSLQALYINEKLKIYLDNIQEYLRDGFTGKDFFKIKILELVYILNGYYSKESLSSFFYPVMNNDSVFTEFVYNNWQSVKSAKELAALSSYCETGFARKFKKVFGVSPYRWLNEKKASKIYRELSNTNKPFKLIAEENMFNSQQHLNDYCIRNFNATPGAIRQKSDKSGNKNTKSDIIL